MRLKYPNLKEGVINTAGYDFGAREAIYSRSEGHHSDEIQYDQTSLKITFGIIVFGILFLVYLVMN